MSLKPLLTALSPRQLFMIDACGAFLTACMLGFVLPVWGEAIGMPRHTLLLLAIVATGFCLYSFTCRLALRKVWRPYLLGIALANTAYCLLTLSLLLVYASQISALGLVYFVGELCIIASLAGVEVRTALYAPSGTSMQPGQAKKS